MLVDDLEATLEKMAQLRSHGVRFALDDFGTGYSSPAYLKRLPIDVLKIDRSFTMDIDAPEHSGQGKRPAVLIDAIVAMAHQLDLRVLAEGWRPWPSKNGCCALAATCSRATASAAHCPRQSSAPGRRRSSKPGCQGNFCGTPTVPNRQGTFPFEIVAQS